MPYCPICKCEFDDTVSACPYCGSDVVDDFNGDETSADGKHASSEGETERTDSGGIDMDDAVLLYKSYSRLNTDFLVETLESAQIPFYCRIVGGHYGRGMPGAVGFFGSKAVDAEIYVPSDFEEDAIEIRRQTVGDE